MDIKILSLSDFPDYIDTVVEWLYSEWGNNNKKFWDSWIRNSLSKQDVPQTFIIFVNGNIAGTYSLWRCDLQSRQDLFPWFGGLYVDTPFRGKLVDGKKLGVRLLNHAIQTLNSLGYKKAYLFTEKNPKYYIDNGWKIIGYAPDEKDAIVTICTYDLIDR